MIMDSENDTTAPEGMIWVCVCCGRTSHDKHEFGDVSCVLNSVLCYEEKKSHPEKDENMSSYHAVPDEEIPLRLK